jgi:hypothetical protein
MKRLNFSEQTISSDGEDSVSSDAENHHWSHESWVRIPSAPRFRAESLEVFLLLHYFLISGVS